MRDLNCPDLVGFNDDLLSHGKILEKVNGDAVRRWQVSAHIDVHELVDFVLGLELGSELFSGDARFANFLDFHFNWNVLIIKI